MKSKQIRAVVLGSKGAGKSALMSQICDTRINENLEYERSITDAKLDVELLVQFSDRLEEIPSAKACFLITDLTSKESMEYMKKILYPKVSKEMAKDGFIYLIGNKSDLEDERQVTSEDFVQFASEKCLMYAEVCCLSGRKRGIDVVQRMLKNRLVNILKSSKKAESQRRLEELPAAAVKGEAKSENVPPELPPRDSSELDSEGLIDFPLQNIKQSNESNILFNSGEMGQELTMEQDTKEENQLLLQELKVLDRSEPTFGQQSSMASYQTNQVNDITLNPQAQIPVVNASLESIAPSKTPQFLGVEEGLVAGSRSAEQDKYLNCLLYTSPSPRD
eukprot:TRINITY_DN4394_c0_g3_i1.p1 TRINITY_DN4394_c0_g3~~TRINITY_DN4394_c0_g3_i1.p1  ORF type:complete len:334 (-),score=98.04 TRINITY_DN4394_c0_g3_i1:53-1054(-)